MPKQNSGFRVGIEAKIEYNPILAVQKSKKAANPINLGA